jgi:hypothetical protein
MVPVRADLMRAIFSQEAGDEEAILDTM